MNIQDITINIFALLAIISTVSGVLFSYLGYRRSKNKEVYSEGDKNANLRADTEYIKRRIDDLLIEQKETNKTLCGHSDRLARVEESSRQAHKRIDMLSKE